MATDGEQVALPDGRTLFVTTEGTAPPGVPTVVLESGMGFSHRMWGTVLPAIAERTKVVAYDRAGFGDSPRDPQPRTLAREADDLLALLRALGSGPFVLVAHSWGGPIVRVVAAAAPDLVAGMVLVDVTDERCDLYFTAAQVNSDRLMVAALPLLTRLGVIQLGVRAYTKRIPADVRESIRATDGRSRSAPAFQAELRDYKQGLRELLAHPPPVPTVPFVHISGARTDGMGTKKRAAINATHAGRADEAPRGRHVVAERSGHMVMFSEPDVIIDEVNAVLDAVTRDPSATGD